MHRYKHSDHCDTQIIDISPSGVCRPTVSDLYQVHGFLQFDFMAGCVLLWCRTIWQVLAVNVQYSVSTDQRKMQKSADLHTLLSEMSSTLAQQKIDILFLQRENQGEELQSCRCHISIVHQKWNHVTNNFTKTVKSWHKVVSTLILQNTQQSWKNWSNRRLRNKVPSGSSALISSTHLD